MAKKLAYPKVKYKLDLLNIFDRAFADKDSKLKAKMRGTLSSALFMQKFGEEIIDTIVKRTLKGIDKNDIPFLPYSKAYMDSIEFKIYNKKTNVNLRLSGQMLSSMKVSKGSYEVTVWIPDEFNNAKAYGHIKGSKVRDFLGLPKDDEAKAMRAVFKRLGSDTIENLIDFEKTNLNGLAFREETVTSLGTVATEQAIENSFIPSIEISGKVIDGNKD